MYVEPNTNMRLLRNVPLDNTYEHTIYFANEQAQRNYFISKTKHSLTRQSYQRKERGYITVGVGYESLIDCNYVMFQNAAFGNKWFYAFITSIEYNNNNSTVVNYEIDVIQTWLFEATLQSCFVEREHSVTDNYYEHLQDEKLDCGEEYKTVDTIDVDLNSQAVLMLSTEFPNLVGAQDVTWRTAQPQLINNVYTSLECHVFPFNTSADLTRLNQYIKMFIDDGKADSIVALYQIPAKFVEEDETYEGVYHVSETYDEAVHIHIHRDLIDGYRPRNRKLYNSPYSIIKLINNSGDAITYKPECWDIVNNTVDVITFRLRGTPVTELCALLYPTRYLGVEQAYEYGLTMTDFPKCAFVGDAFKAWWAQNHNTTVANILSAGLRTAAFVESAREASQTPFITSSTEFVTGAMALRAGANLGGEILSSLAKVSDLQALPKPIHGQAQTASLNAGIGRLKFTFFKQTIRAEYARIIDDYFDRFGYLCKRNKVPNRDARNHWCYCKTIGCTITGGVPSDDMSKICSIYDNGITWWKNGDEVGDYTLDNTVALT